MKKVNQLWRQLPFTSIKISTAAKKSAGDVKYLCLRDVNICAGGTGISVQERAMNICARERWEYLCKSCEYCICARESCEYLCKRELRISVQERAENICTKESWEYLFKRELGISVQERDENISARGSWENISARGRYENVCVTADIIPNPPFIVFL